MYAAVGAAAFLGLSLRRPLPAIVILLVLAGFGFTTDESARDPWPALAFVLLAGGMLAVSRSLRRERTGATDALAGGVTAVAAALLALSILGTTTVEAGRPLRDWRQWDILGAGIARFRFDLMQNYPRLLDPAEDEVVMRVRSAVPSYWRANVLETFSGISWRGGVPDGRQLEPDLSDGDWVYDVPPAQPAPQGRLVTQRFEIVRAYTDRLFSGGWPEEVSVRMPLVLRMTGATAIAVAPPRGPELEYTVKAVVPDLGPTDLIGRGRYYPEDVARRYLGLPFPARPQPGGAEAEAEWRAAADALPAGREWVDLYALNESIVGAETEPYRVALAVEQYLRTNYHYSLRPPDRGIRLALRRVPLRDAHRVLPALRRRHGRAPPLQRDPGPRRRRVHRGRGGAERRVRGQPQRRPLLGRGVLPGRRVGAVRPDARDGRSRAPAARRSTVPTPPPRPVSTAPERRPRRPVTHGRPGRPGSRTRAAPARSRRRRPPSPAAGGRGRSGCSPSSSPGRRAARCCAGAAWSAAPRRRGCGHPSPCCTPTCGTAASQCRPRRRWMRRRPT